MGTFVTYIDTNSEKEKMNPLKALIKFLEGKAGSFRFGDSPYGFKEEDLRYETIADGNRNMREDLKRFGSDWKNTINSISENGKKN